MWLVDQFFFCFFYYYFVIGRRFEKLDITPKSAQKIKPVLEQWMKEAEERLEKSKVKKQIFLDLKKKLKTK